MCALAAAGIAALSLTSPGLAAAPCGALLLLPPATPAGQTTLFGHIQSLSRSGGGFRMRFSPAFLLSGLPAEEEAFAATGSRDVPNDTLTVESRRVFTYAVPAIARVTVITHGTCTSRRTVAKLAALVKKRTDFGFWIRVSRKYPSPVLELDEQYHP
jgi:hypothetical protein